MLLSVDIIDVAVEEGLRGNDDALRACEDSQERRRNVRPSAPKWSHWLMSICTMPTILAQGLCFMARETTTELLYGDTYAERLSWLREELEDFEPKERQGIERCALALRQVMNSHSQVEKDVAILLVHCEHMACEEAALNASSESTSVLSS